MTDVTGGAMLLAGYLMPVSPITVGCHPAGGIGCAIFAPITGMLLGALHWLAVVVATTVGVGVALSGLSVRFVGVRLGITAPLAWPGMLWASPSCYDRLAPPFTCQARQLSATSPWPSS